MTALGSTRQRKVREVLREPINSLGGDRISEEWLRIKQYSNSTTRKRNIVRTRWTSDGWQAFPMDSTFVTAEADGVAMKEKIFGEGAERIVREFREVNSKGIFVGPSMVGKESRFIE